MNCEQKSIVYVFIPKSFPQSEILFSFLLSFGSSKSSSSSGNTELEELECSQCEKRFKNARGQTTHFHQVHELKLYTSAIGLIQKCAATVSRIDALIVSPHTITTK
jgi:hypothetical protein